MYEIVDPYTTSSAWVACAASTEKKNDRENRKKDYEGEIEGPYPGFKSAKDKRIF